MPSASHEALVELFRSRPDLAAEVLRALGMEIPAYVTAATAEADLSEAAPVELRADLVVVLRDANGGGVLAIVVEVQLARDDAKLWTWPVYGAQTRMRNRCPATVLVVTPDPSVRRWAASVIERIDREMRGMVSVLDPERMPVANATQNLELAVLTVLARGDKEMDRDAVMATVDALLGSQDEFAAVYFDLILNRLPDALRQAVEERMASGNYEYQSDFAKKYYGQGKAEGEAKGKAEAILAVLGARGIAVTDADRTLVLSTLDSALLKTWLTRAATCGSASEVFAD